jgi:hypothetical protein
MNASGGYTRYQVPGQKVTKITFSRESSICGNPALFVKDQTLAKIVQISNAEDVVDMTFNCVVDGALDD